MLKLKSVGCCLVIESERVFWKTTKVSEGKKLSTHPCNALKRGDPTYLDQCIMTPMRGSSIDDLFYIYRIILARRPSAFWLSPKGPAKLR